MTMNLHKAQSNPIIRCSLFIFFSVIGLLYQINSPAPVHACTQPVGGHPPFVLEEHIDASEAIFLGKVVKHFEYPPIPQTGTPNTTSTPNRSPIIYFAEVEVSNYFKGAGKDTITIAYYGPGSICLQGVGIDDTYIFFGNPDNTYEQIDYQATRSGSLTTTLGASQENIQAVLDSLGIGLTTHIYLPMVVHNEDNATVEQSTNKIGAFIKSKLLFLNRLRTP